MYIYTYTFAHTVVTQPDREQRVVYTARLNESLPIAINCDSSNIQPYGIKKIGRR